jgi:hypothetical protein
LIWTTIIAGAVLVSSCAVVSLLEPMLFFETLDFLTIVLKVFPTALIIALLAGAISFFGAGSLGLSARRLRTITVVSALLTFIVAFIALAWLR